MAYSTITAGELANDKPVTQSLLRKFKNNILGHGHAGGQGGTLVSDSFADKSATAGKFVDRVLETTKIVSPFTIAVVGSVKVYTSFYRLGNFEVEVPDTDFVVNVTVAGRRQLMVQAWTAINGVAISQAIVEIALQMDAVQLTDSRIKVRLDPSNEVDQPHSINTYALVDLPSVGVHSFRLSYKNVGQINSAKNLTLNQRQMIIMEIAKP